VAGVRVLLTEGSSLTSREVITCLGPLGHHIEVLDPDGLCLGRFSRWVSRVHRCPPAAQAPIAYVEYLTRTVGARAIDVVLPTHEQAWLLAAARHLLPEGVGLALADASAFAHVQSKLAFAALLDELGLPQPRWRTVEASADVADLDFPYWLKSPYSTAGRGVREVRDRRSRERALGELLGDAHPLAMAQLPAAGRYAQAQGLFDSGALIAAHTSEQRGVGMGGSAAARVSVDHGQARDALRRLGAALHWHGGLTLDYLHLDGAPQFIECNPRTVEPANAAASGVNIPDLQVRLSLGEPVSSPLSVGHAGVRTHALIALLMGSASREPSRRRLLAELRDSLLARGRYAGSTEQLTPVVRDPPSLLPLGFIAARLLAAPGDASGIAARAVENYSIGPATIEAVTTRHAPARP
jgi:predicted ATP-grasp superfamily ATP-dependent carboligase